LGKYEDFRQMLDEQIQNFSDDAEKHKRLYRACRYSVSILGALSAVLAALTFWFDDNLVKLAVVIASSASGVIAFTEGLRKPYELWLNERSTHHSLQDLQREVQFYLDEDSTSEEIEPYFLRRQSIVIASGQNWAAAVSTNSGMRTGPNQSPVDSVE